MIKMLREMNRDRYKALQLLADHLRTPSKDLSLNAIFNDVKDEDLKWVTEKIQGSTDDHRMVHEREAVTMVYIDSTQGWLPVNDASVGGAPLQITYGVKYLVVAGGGEMDLIQKQEAVLEDIEHLVMGLLL